ncbi:MAG: NAD(P)/FAD-dependent oxidoreductase, partial [Bacteroidia bacterium]
AHPQLANVAINQGKNLAHNFLAIQNNRSLTEYEYKDLGSMATIGKYKAVVDLPNLKFQGYLAWYVWMFLHLMLILSVRNKFLTFMNWTWNFLAKDSSLRLIFKSEK